MASWWRSNLTTRGNNTFMGGEIKMKNKKGTLRSLQNVFSSFSLLNILWILLLLLIVVAFLLLMMLPFGTVHCHMIPQVIVTPVSWIFYLHQRARSMVLKTICYISFVFSASSFDVKNLDSNLTSFSDNLTILCISSLLKVSSFVDVGVTWIMWSIVLSRQQQNDIILKMM